VDYKSAGVDIKAGEDAVTAIKQLARSTYNTNVLSDLGSFGGLFQLDLKSWSNPVLVASTDGVGTKLRVAIMAGVYDTIGQDLVNHCVNDILVQGALPQFFLDYIGCGILIPDRIREIISGMAEACRKNKCALIGGEMAEMPGFYQEMDFDLVGTIVGLVERQNILPSGVKAGDVVLGFASSGLHTNGYSLARKIIFEKLGLKVDSFVPECNESVADLLLKVHVSYLDKIEKYLNDRSLHALAHITGGGIEGNLKRVIPRGFCAVIDSSKIPCFPLFNWLKDAGALSIEALRAAFNLGVGMIAVCDTELAGTLCERENAFHLGFIEAKSSDKNPVYFI